MLKKGISFIFFLILSSPVLFAVDMDVLVRNQRFQNDTFFFDIYMQRSGDSNVYLGNSDLILNFEEANFSNPELYYVSGSSELYNAHGNITAFYDSNIGTRIEYAGPNAYRLMVYVQMPGYNNATDFKNRLARIDGQELTNKLGTFYVTGATQLNTNPELSWVSTGEGLVVKINHRDSASMAKQAVSLNPVNPALNSQPTIQATNLQVVSKNGNSISLSWTNGNGSKRMVLAKNGSSINEFPADGLIYTANPVFGSGSELGTSNVFVVYYGSGDDTVVTGLDTNTTYHFAVMEVNGDNGWSENYLTAGADTVSQTTDGLYIVANVKVFLQGPYNAGAGAMNTSLRGNVGLWSVIPSGHPYKGAPWNYNGAENVDSSTHPSDMVDWVLVELRSTYNGAAVTGGRAAGFLLSDGSIVDTNGVDPIRFWNVNSGYYYIVIKHRNHLPVMSRDSILLAANSSMYDFTTGGQIKAYGNDTSSATVKPMINLANGRFAMRAGDANSNGQVKYNGSGADRTVILSVVGLANPNAIISNTYSTRDVNLDRQVKYNGSGADRVSVLSTVGLANPNAIVSSQLP